jgi:hypothetical protein
MAIAGQSAMMKLFDGRRAGNEIDDFVFRLNQPNRSRNQGVDKFIVIIMV